MANTVTTLNYANTFGDWLVATDALISENNILAAGDYTKTSGTLYLNETTQNSLQANGSIVVQKQLLVQGTGSSATIQNNLTVGGQVYFTNSALGLTHTGQANLNGLVLVQGSGIGIQVSNSAYVGGSATIQLNTITNNLQANSSVNTANASITNTVYAKTVQANTLVNTVTLNASGTAYVNQLESNTGVNTGTISISSTAHANTLQANTSVLTATLTANTLVYSTNFVANGSISASSSVLGSNLQANNSVLANTVVANTSVTGPNFVSTDTISSSNSIFTNTLQANTSVTTNTVNANTLVAAPNIISTGSISANNTILADRLQANSSIVTGSLTANTVVTAANIISTGSISANNTILADRLQANSTINTSIGYASVWQANTRVTTNNVVTIDASASNTIYANVVSSNVSVITPRVSVSNLVDANNAAGFFNTIQTSGQLSVGGNFVINGITVYNSNAFVLSAASPNQTSYIGVYRAGANAYIRWNESTKIWDMYNVNNSNYYRILTDEFLNDTTTNTSTTLVATANAVYKATVNAAAASTYANGSFVKANAAFAQANAAFASANNVAPQVAPAFTQANSAFARANTSSNTYVGTTGSVSPSSGVVSFTSNNGITIVATTANNLAISTSQDLRTTGNPTFSSLTLGSPLAIAQGGTGQTSASDALTALLPTGTTAGYVLTTGGPGNFYWAAGGGGGSGATPGTTINSTRLSYTANGAAGFTGNTFTTPTFTTSTQVRAYINGVRQFESEYVLNQSANTIRFTTNPLLNDSILVEVDGYFVNPYYANNIAYTINNNISPTANTIQLAIDGLTSKLTTYYANTAAGSGTQAFNNVVTGLTMPAGTSNTAFATTAYVQNLANNSGTLVTNITGNSGTVTNGVYTSGSYANPSWITSLASSKITGTFASTSITGLATSATTDTTNASNISSGTLNAARLPTSGIIAGIYGTSSVVPTITVDTYGRITGVSNSAISITSGSVSGLAASATTDTTNASNITSGTLNSARLPTISAGIITGLAASATTDTTNATNITSGTLNALRLPFSMDQSVTTTNNVRFNSLGVGTAASGTAGEIRATNEITAYYSDERLKTKLGDIENALNKVCSLSGFYYEPNETAQALGYEVKKQVGVSAQEVYKVLPEVTAPAPIDPQYLTVHYDKLVPLLIEAIKELKAEVEALKGNNK